jgi:hypothetical protein
MLSRISSVFAALAFIGCGASQSSVQDPNRGFASTLECNRVADHLYTMYEHGSAPPDRPTESVTHGGAPYYTRLYNDFMAQCTTKLSHKDAECLLNAPGYPEIRACQIENGTPLILGTREGRRRL